MNVFLPACQLSSADSQTLFFAIIRRLVLNSESHLYFLPGQKNWVSIAIQRTHQHHSLFKLSKNSKSEKTHILSIFTLRRQRQICPLMSFSFNIDMPLPYHFKTRISFNNSKNIYISVLFHFIREVSMISDFNKQ